MVFILLTCTVGPTGGPNAVGGTVWGADQTLNTLIMRTRKPVGCTRILTEQQCDLELCFGAWVWVAVPVSESVDGATQNVCRPNGRVSGLGGLAEP